MFDYVCSGGEVRLVVHDKNATALRFWQCLGLSVVEIGSELYGDQKVKVYIIEKGMQKRITKAETSL